ncbi:dihydrofolate reductase family protein [Streptomyces niveus]|uniref:dihydrofolate reductase family protein n=1 Tax=Streptomyces niveus TaxID=193462 RepID=UPI0034282E49
MTSEHRRSTANPAGNGADRIGGWIHAQSSWRERTGLDGGEADRDSEIMREWFEATGSVVMGRLMYDSGVEFWGGNPPFHTPVFVLTNRPAPTLVKEGGTSFTFVTDGIHSALDQAKAAAGDRNADIAGGADTASSSICGPALSTNSNSMFCRAGRARPRTDPRWTPPAPLISSTASSSSQEPQERGLGSGRPVRWTRSCAARRAVR